MKNKKTRNSLVGILITSIIFSISAVSVMANSSGYDKYKKAAMNLIKSKNYEIELKSSIIYNGKMVEVNRAEYKTNDKATLITNYYGEDISYGSYSDENCSITLENNIPTYYSSYGGYSSFSQLENLTPAQEKFMDVLLDSFIGDTKNHFVIDNNNISLSLSEEQLPPIVNAFINLMVEEMNSYGYTYDTMDFYNILLLDNPGVKSFAFNGSLDDKGQISDFDVSVELGAYENNIYKNLIFNFNGKVSNINNTVIIKPEVSQELIDEENNYYNDYYSEEEITEGVYIDGISY